VSGSRSRGGETILLVEDEVPLRRLAVRGLTRHGYTVLEAATAEEALAILDRHLQDVSLIVTDVVMPGINGRQLVDRVRALRADIKVLYTSGYTADTVVNTGVEQAQVAFLQKPYTPRALMEKVSFVLGEPPES